MFRTKSKCSTTTRCVPSFEVVEWVVHPDGGVGPILHEAIFAKNCNFQTRILMKFLSVLSYKFHQSRLNLSFSSCSWLAPTQCPYLFSVVEAEKTLLLFWNVSPCGNIPQQAKSAYLQPSCLKSGLGPVISEWLAQCLKGLLARLCSSHFCLLCQMRFSWRKLMTKLLKTQL